MPSAAVSVGTMGPRKFLACVFLLGVGSFCREGVGDEKMSFFALDVLALDVGVHGPAGAGSRRPVSRGFCEEHHLPGLVSLL